MSHTDDDTVVAEYIFNLINANKADLLIDTVLYGNHVNLPSAGVAVVTAMGKRRILAGVSAPGGRTENQLMVLIELNWSKVGDESTERRAADTRANLLEDLIHSDTTLDGIIIHGFISEVDRGEVTSNNSMFRSVRMSFVGKTKTYLTPTP